MIRDWDMQDDNILIPPEYHLKPTNEAKLWLSDLARGGIIFEKTGDYYPVKHSINAGVARGFINEAFRYTHKVETDFQIPQELNEEGIKEGNTILKRLFFAKNAFRMIQFVSIPILMVSVVSFCIAMLMSIVIVNLATI